MKTTMTSDPPEPQPGTWGGLLFTVLAIVAVILVIHVLEKLTDHQRRITQLESQECRP